MTNLVYDEEGEEVNGRTLTDDEYANITTDELLDAINHSGWACDILEIDNHWRFTKESDDKVHSMTAHELKTLIQENKGVLVRCLDEDDPIWKRVGYNCMSSEHFGHSVGNLREYLAHLV
jgi:hypothetical protein